MIYAQLDPHADNFIPDAEGNYMENLGLSFWSSFSLNNPYFSYEESVKPWLGEELVLTKASPDLLDPFVVLAEVGDKTEALKTIENLEKEFAGSKGSLQKERYKGVDIYIVTDPVNMAAAYFKGYAILSTLAEPIKQIIDVGSGDAVSLSQNKEFKKLESNFQESDRLLMVSLRLADVLQATTSSLGAGPQLFVKQLNLPENVLLGLGFWSQSEGLQIKTYLSTAHFESFAEIEPHLQAKIPSNAIAFYEGKNFASLASEFMGQVEINDKSVGWASGPYALTLLPQTGDKKSAFGLIMDIGDDTLAQAKLREAEPIVVGGLAALGISGDKEFRDGKIDDLSTRYINLQSGIKMDLNYIVSDGYAFFATSPEGLKMLLDTHRGNTAGLIDDDGFVTTFSQTTVPRQIGYFYLQTEAFSKLFAPVAVGTVSEDIPKGFLEQVLSPFQNLGVSIYNTGSGDFLTKIFLKFKPSE